MVVELKATHVNSKWILHELN